MIPVAANDIAEWKSAHEAMVAVGLGVPVPWEHPAVDDDTGYPVPKTDPKFNERDASRLNAGWLEGFEVDTDGVLHATVSVKDDAAEDLKKVGSYFSPQFGPWTDPNSGKEYPNCVTHLCITPRPATTGQTKEFKDAVKAAPVVALSQLLRESKQQIQLSIGDSVGTERPDALGDGALPDVKDKSDKDGDRNDSETPNDQENTVGKIRAALEAFGVHLADDSAISGDEKALLSVLDVLTNHHKGLAEGREDADPANPGATGGDTVDLNNSIREEPTIVAMSQATKTPAELAADQVKAAADKAKQLALSQAQTVPALPAEVQAQLSQQASTNAALSEKVTAMERKDYLGRIDAAFDAGKCTNPKADQLRKLATTHQFSAAGATPGTVELNIRLEEIESREVGSVWTDQEKTVRLSVQEEPLGIRRGPDEQVSETDADKIVDDMFPMARQYHQMDHKTVPA